MTLKELNEGLKLRVVYGM